MIIKRKCLLVALVCGSYFIQLSCTSTSNRKPHILSQRNQTTGVKFYASDSTLVNAFNWARARALSFAHDGSDPVGHWYEAALPNREAFCMRDVSHQVIGAEILGLSKHNFNMMTKFAENISEEKDFCSYWEINRYDLPAPVDYESDEDFWYNLPANFDVIFSAKRLYDWTGNMAYLNGPEFKKFYELSLNEYVAHWQLGADHVLQRDRALHTIDHQSARFGNKRGIPTYNEGGRGETILGIDMTASLIAAYDAYAEMLTVLGDVEGSEEYALRAKHERDFLEDFWWDGDKGTFRSIWYEDKTFDHFMVGNDQAFQHYLYYFDVVSDQAKIDGLVRDYRLHFDQLIVELKSYLPIMFYENGQTKIANQMVVDLCSEHNHRRDYPENSFTVIEHLTRGLMGVAVDATSQTFSTWSRLDDDEKWAELLDLPLLSNEVSVRHLGQINTIVKNESGPAIRCKVKFSGTHDILYVDGVRASCQNLSEYGQPYSYVEIDLLPGQTKTVSLNQ